MTATAKNVRAKISLEALEDRLALTATLSNGTLIIDGTAGHDHVVVSQTRVSYQVVDNGVVSQFYYGFRVNSIRFTGGNGNDYFENRTSLPSLAYGQGGVDTLIGGSGSDVLDGGRGLSASLDGGDELVGNGGDDFLYGGAGNDYLSGGAGNDKIYGDDGHDILAGGDGNDILYAGVGNDYLSGGDGADDLYGEAGNDTLLGGLDGLYDNLNGGSGADTFQVENQMWFNGVAFIRIDTPADFNANEDFLIIGN